MFGCKSHSSIDWRYGFIRAAAVTSASHPNGRMLRQIIDRQNTGSEVWSDSAYRSQSKRGLARRELQPSIGHSDVFTTAKCAQFRWTTSDLMQLAPRTSHGQ